MGLSHDYAALGARGVGVSHGENATLRRTVPGSYDPVAGTTGSDTVTDYAVDAIPVTAEQAGFSDQSMIEINDRFVSVPGWGLSITPDPETDAMLFGVDVWTIRNILMKRAGSTVVSYALHLRK